MTVLSIDPCDVCPKRFGLNYDPPCIILEHLQVSTGKLFHRRIGLRSLRASSNAARVAEKLRQRNASLLGEDKVSFDQLVSLVQKLTESLKDKQQAAGSGVAGSSESSSAPKDSSSCAPASSTKREEPAAAVTTATSPTERPAAAAVQNNSSPTSPAAAKISDNFDYQSTDLNKLSTEELSIHKAKMDVAFFQNQKKPGDPDFVYDVQVEFEVGEEENGWDDDDSDDGNS
eukprot:gnl/TRDRNA2_/TRDRNA2_29411_c0_seq1.p1 gnl/TRDRNA2_/TRDRNA2_29411_c0~~gnl/TRDRNA2_/TRDRNA2_29411_c0_seq1.p1  ORF type:complete len:230 (+),score=58.47 gnl/TRDRNA2_/TRDRNA2_29411_c0_seq1:61-750(+)